MELNKRRNKKCYGLLLVLFTIFLCSLNVYSSVSAFNFGNVGIMSVSGIVASGDKGGSYVSDSQYVSTLGSEYKVDVSPATGVETGTTITTIDIDIYNRTVPANSLFAINLRFQGLKTNLLEWSGQNFIILDKYCVEVGTDDYNCTLWAYNSTAITGDIFILGKWWFDYGFGYINTPVQFNFVGISAESGGSGGSSGLTQQDKDFLQQQIAQVRGLVGTSNGLIQTTNDQLNALRILISSQAETQQETLENIQSAIEEQTQLEEDAVDNISNQSTSDISDATDQQTTNIIGFIGNFLSALQNVQPSNCQLTLPFPNFAGGSRTVNICDGKQYAPSIVTIAGSLLLIITFVPLAYIILRMIYNEIRSWTNG